MAYLSALIQRFGKPINIYALVLQHRQFLLVFSFLCDLFIIWRFGFVGTAFILFYEFSKFYVFGDRFLAEAFVVYPLVYMTGLVLHRMAKKNVSASEVVLSSILTWFVVFMREPYVLVALMLFCVILFGAKIKKVSFVSLGIFILLTASLRFLFPLQNFIYDVVIINLKASSLSVNG